MQAALNSAFKSASTPSFVGPVTVIDFAFGDAAPDVELLDITDVWHDFTADDGLDDDDAGAAPKAKMPAPAPAVPVERASSELPPPPPPPPQPRDEGRQRIEQWRRHRDLSLDADLDGIAAFSDASSRGGGTRPPSFMPGLHRPHPPAAALLSPSTAGTGSMGVAAPSARSGSPFPTEAPPLPSEGPKPTEEGETPDDQGGNIPSLQLHMHVAWQGALTLTLATELRVNYPAHSFLALPITLSIVSLAFQGTFVVALEGPKRRVHFSLLDPSQGESRRSSVSPADVLLRDVVIESEVGAKDKHVLRNVGKVERFVLDLVRTTLSNEIIFP